MESSITDKKTIGEKFGDKKVRLYSFNLFQLLNKKPPSNNKYKEVKKVLDTGKTIKDVEVLSDQYVSKRKNELFKRIKASTVVKLLEENNNSESIYNLAEESKEENIYNMNDNITTKSVVQENESVYSYKTDKTDKTTKTTVTAITYATEMLGNLVKIKLIIQSQLTFLLLDLRDKSDYDHYHIKEAFSYPGPNISRDKFSVEMINLVNFQS